MTGCHSIRSGTDDIPIAGETGGIVARERTVGNILSDVGYATACFGKWYIDAEKGQCHKQPQQFDDNAKGLCLPTSGPSWPKIGGPIPGQS